MLEKKLFTLVFAGGFNTGKSSFINVLLQPEIYKEGEKGVEPLCLEGATPTTSKIHVLRYGEEPRREEKGEALLIEEVPNKRLHNLHIEIVDTPGTDSTNPLHDELTKEFIPKADIVFFLFSIDQPFTRTEAEFLKHISERWRREVVFILNKIDTKRNLKGEVDWEAIQSVVEDIRSKGREILGRDILLFPLSVQFAKEAIYQGREDLWKLSGMEEVENYINHQLQEILYKIKLRSSTEAGISLVEQCLERVEEELHQVQVVETALSRLEELVREYFGIPASSWNTEGAVLLERFDELLEEILALVDRVFTLQNLVAAFVRGGADRLKGDFQKELQNLFPKFLARLEKDFSHLMGHFRREFQLVVRENQLEGLLGEEAYQKIEELERDVEKQFQNLFRHIQESDLQELLESLTQRLMISLGSWVLGVITLLSALGSLISNPFSAILGGGLIGGGVILGGTFWYQRKRKELERTFSAHVEEMKKELRERLSQRMESEILKKYIGSLKTKFSKERREKESLKKALFQIKEELEALKKEVALL